MSAAPDFRRLDATTSTLDAAIALRNGVAANSAPTHAHPDAEPPRRPLRALDVHELAATQFRQREPLLAPWLHSQDLCMVFAGRGIGKTHFSLAVAYAVATGGKFLDWQAQQPAKVLYLDGELPGDVLKGRLALHVPNVEPAPGFLRIFTPDLPELDGRALPDLATPSGQAEIDSLIEDDTALVIVDNLSAWARSGRENEAESWHPVATWILGLRRRGIAVILVHHAGKSGLQRGTSKKEDLLDVVIGLSRPKDYEANQGAEFIAEFTKARHLMGDDAASLHIALKESDQRALWTWKTVEASTYERVLLLTADGMKPNEIAAELEMNKSTVSRHLRTARERGDLPKASTTGGAHGIA